MKKSHLIILLIILCSGLQVIAADRCHVCGKELSGQYYTFTLDNTQLKICPDCVQNLGRCSMCGIPVKYTSPDEKDVLCSSCRLKAKKCSVCGNPVIGRYYTDSNNHIFCEKCYREAERCSVCDGLLVPSEWQYYKGDKVCLDCLNNKPRCHACGRIITGRYSQYTGFDGYFCSSCADHTPACVSCLRPTGPDPIRLPNGNAICRDCAATAIKNKNQLNGIIVEVSRYMDQNLLMRVDNEIKFKLVDVVNYDRHSDQYRESGRFVRVNNDFTIKILMGLSRPLCIETVAHELAHAWQAENCPHLPGDELIEGFAQWVAGKVLLGFGYSQLIPRLDNRNDVYGRGYKRLTEMEHNYGFSGVFRELKRLGNPPE